MTRDYRLPHLRKGFAALEAVIAVVIVGMVLAFTLKGLPAVSAMRAYILAQQINQYRGAAQQYLAEYRAPPGDDDGARGRWSRPEALYDTPTGPASFAGDGKINGLLDDSSNPLGEQYLFWTDLRLAGFVEGDATLVGQSARPESMNGVTYGFAEANLGLEQVLCLTRVSGDDAVRLDVRLDDGVISTGKLRGTSRWDPVEAKNYFSEPDTEPYNPEKTYIICLPYVP